MEVGRNILEVPEERRLRWFGHVKRMPGKRLPLKILEWEPKGTGRRGRPKERWIDGVRRSMTNHGLTDEDTRDRGQNLVLVKENHCRVDRPLEDDDDYNVYISICLKFLYVVHYE
jgi:hypothetical protein